MSAEIIAITSFGLIVPAGGAAVYADPFDVRLGVDRGDGSLGTLLVPPTAKVLGGFLYGGDGNQYEGTLIVAQFSPSRNPREPRVSGRFNELMERSNAVAIRVMGEYIYINGIGIFASIEQQKTSPRFVIGGKNEGTEFVVWVNAFEFRDIPGAGKNSVVKWGTLTSRIQQIDPSGDGMLMLTCGPFEAGKIPGV